eukprot:5777961-Alexandrium_andersonii.AAC.1
MSASLVGSEMCIRDRFVFVRVLALRAEQGQWLGRAQARARERRGGPRQGQAREHRGGAQARERRSAEHLGGRAGQMEGRAHA